MADDTEQKLRLAHALEGLDKHLRPLVTNGGYRGEIWRRDRELALLTMTWRSPSFVAH